MQYFLGLEEFQTEALFDASMMVHFRRGSPRLGTPESAAAAGACGPGQVSRLALGSSVSDPPGL